MFNIAWFIFLSPFLGFILILLFGNLNRHIPGIVSSLSILISFIISGIIFLTLKSSVIYQSYAWFFSIRYGVYIDHLSIAMALMVSFVSLMIHIFASYYMKGDPNKRIYFAETSLFTAGMLGLVIASNLVFFFLFWELVGLCSYLLIGFWYFKPNATAAAKKAFIVTRVGDMLFLVGMALLYTYLAPITSSPLSIPYLVTNIPVLVKDHVITAFQIGLVSVLFLGGAIGKSSQFPLHVWIPDAMEGPTTVSALIHAATMVTAGVYLVARIFPLFLSSSSFALYAVLIIGSFTAIYAGTLGIVMNDIKRVLAYSTISQLGYMMAALGIGALIGASAISLSIYQLMVHAFFKATLFLAAGAVLIALMDLRDIKKMGGLWRKMPITITLMLFAALTLSGIYPTAGFFSKGAIIAASYSYFIHYYSFSSILPYLFLLFGEFFTALYTFRMFFLVSLGKPRSYLAEHARDPPYWALLPVGALAVLSLIFGIFQGSFYHYIESSYSAISVPVLIQYLPLIIALLGILTAYLFFGTERWKTSKLEKRKIHRVLKNKYYLDVLFTNIIAERVIYPVSSAIGRFEARYNKGNESFGGGIIGIGSFFKKLQDGVLENYFVILVIGIAVLLLIVEILGGF